MFRKLSLAAVAAIAVSTAALAPTSASSRLARRPALFLRRLLWLPPLGPDRMGSAAALGLLIGPFALPICQERPRTEGPGP
jgi:hypothetical protein